MRSFIVCNHYSDRREWAASGGRLTGYRDRRPSRTLCQKSPHRFTKPVGKGTGLGLSISYQIVVEKHGGNLECISETGQGAEFRIKIPIAIPVISKKLE